MRVRSYAKINWILEVFGSRPDGYHELRTILQTIDLFDTLTFSSLPTGEIEIECDNPDVPLDGTNLISRAIQLVAGRTGCKKGVKVSIYKQIPIGAGLGGSSNAAATIMAMEKLWDIPLEPQDLFEIGTSSGADVPFFFFGGTAAGVGRGNEIYPLEDVDSRHLLLVNPRISVPTREACLAETGWLVIPTRTVGRAEYKSSLIETI